MFTNDNPLNSTDPIGSEAMSFEGGSGEIIGDAGGVGGVIGAEGEVSVINIEEANFAQKTASNTFSKGGTFSGKTIEEVARGIDSGKISIKSVKIQVIDSDGRALILNTRSALALEEAGIPRSEWIVEDMSANGAAQSRLGRQLARNGLGRSGTPTVRITGR